MPKNSPVFTTDLPCDYPGDHSVTVLQFMSVGNDTRYYLLQVTVGGIITIVIIFFNFTLVSITFYPCCCDARSAPPSCCTGPALECREQISFLAESVIITECLNFPTGA